MRKKTPAPPAGPVQDRIAVINRVKARRPPDRIRSYPSVDGGEPLVSRSPAEGTDRLPPQDLQQWCDDRTVGAFGGRIRLNEAEAAAHVILEAMRSGDPKVVRETVRTAGQGLDVMLRYLIAGVLADWKAKAPGYAVDVASAAVGEARKAGWDQRPRMRRRGPEPLSQVPGERVA